MTAQKLLSQTVSALDREALKKEFLNNDEFVIIRNFLSESLLEAFLEDLECLRPSIYRNFIPNHKKGGSVSRFEIDRLGRTIPLTYRNPSLFALLNELAGGDLQECPAEDPHTYALYYYTEPGDHIGYHYDNSYYKGRRYTLLLGLIDNSSSKLECELYRDNSERETQFLSFSLKPGTLVFFNGDRLYHRVTPLGENEERIALTMEFVTDIRMNWFLRFVSNIKDSIAYFGFKTVFSKNGSRL
tara:strand:- start:415 stop:1143 length:729 start_codon:yes stop_codon:yes gene_type:complete